MSKTANRIIRALDKLLNAAIAITAVLFLLISAYSLLDNMRQVQIARDPSLFVYKPGTDNLLTSDKRISDTQVAWVSLEGTNIDFPVMQGSDNYTYLNLDPYGEFSLSGSIFLDYQNSSDFSDDYSMVYGHHMTDGAMFGSLDLYRDEAYFSSHRKGRLITSDTIYDLDLIAVCSAEGTDPVLFDPARQTASTITEYLAKNAMYLYKPEEGKRFVALSTCSGETYFSRLLVIGQIRERVQ